MSDPRRSPLAVLSRASVVGLVGLAVGGLLAAKVLASAEGDVTIFTAFGQDAVAITDHAERTLGREVFLRLGQGHDGKFFYLQALDPLYLNPDEHAVFLDRPSYRGQRMLYPLIAGGFGLVPAGGVVWAMVLINVVALGFGSWGAAILARNHGASAWWGLAFGLNPGLLAEMAIDGGGIVAFAAAIWAVVAIEKEQHHLAVVWLTASVLAREAMLLFVAGFVAFHWTRTRRLPWSLLMIPAAAVGLWGLYVRLRLGVGSGINEVQEIGVPFVGALEAFDRWKNQPFDLLMGILVLVLLAAVLVRVIKTPSYLAWGSVGFIILAVLLTRQVWLKSFDISRAIAPLFTVFVLVTFATSRSPTSSTARGMHE